MKKKRGEGLKNQIYLIHVLYSTIFAVFLLQIVIRPISSKESAERERGRKIDI